MIVLRKKRKFFNANIEYSLDTIVFNLLLIDFLLTLFFYRYFARLVLLKFIIFRLEMSLVVPEGFQHIHR
jgi:uncharacterized protein YebE (UPF0316 family)